MFRIAQGMRLRIGPAGWQAAVAVGRGVATTAAKPAQLCLPAMHSLTKSSCALPVKCFTLASLPQASFVFAGAAFAAAGAFAVADEGFELA